MKARLAKKIIKASEYYWYYCKYCNTRKKYKSNERIDKNNGEYLPTYEELKE